MAIAYNTKRTIDYVLEEDQAKSTEEKTVFKLAVLDREQYRKVLGLITKYQNVKAEDLAHFYDDIVDLVKTGLRGWENFKNEQGGEVLFFESVIEEALDRLQLQELATAIIAINSTSGQDLKNSKSQQASS